MSRTFKKKIDLPPILEVFGASLTLDISTGQVIRGWIFGTFWFFQKCQESVWERSQTLSWHFLKKKLFFGKIKIFPKTYPTPGDNLPGSDVTGTDNLHWTNVFFWDGILECFGNFLKEKIIDIFHEIHSFYTLSSNVYISAHSCRIVMVKSALESPDCKYSFTQKNDLYQIRRNLWGYTLL